MSYYQRHIFFCQNQRDDGQPCCHDQGAEQAFERCKQLVKQRDLRGPGKVRVNRAGCLDRCDDGPVCVVYPDAVWYRYVDLEDIEEIVSSHLAQGQPVTRLQI